MASHLSTKLSKPNLLATSIPSSVTSILGEALLPMALRLSGQLLLGVARIYSRKAKYLLDDCNETLSKVKRAFRPGQQVDLEDSEVGGRDAGGRREAINLRAEEGGIEDLLNNEAGMNYWFVPCPSFLSLFVP
jgi:cohesin complex subunit SCC1